MACRTMQLRFFKLGTVLTYAFNNSFEHQETNQLYNVLLWFHLFDMLDVDADSITYLDWTVLEICIMK